MPMPDLTPAQLEAVATLDRDVCVSAGAGSGKTRVLVERFCQIVESGQAAVGEILTLTFTEKAAREMKQRIVERFAMLAREAKGETRRRREQDRRDVETAYIGTIHAFCARVLRENALEAGVDPQFTVLDAPAAETRRREALDDALAERYQTDPLGTAELADALGPEALRAGALALHERARRLGRTPADLRFESPSPPVEHAADLAAAVCALVNPPEGSKPDPRAKVSKTLAAKLAALGEAWRKAEVALRAGSSWEAVEAVRDISDAIDKKGAEWTRPLVEQLRAAADAVMEGIVGDLAARQMPALRALLESLDGHYRARKDAIGGLDYDDLLILTRELFAGDSPTAQAYRRAIKFILMDEFQDTNRLQMEVIDAIGRPGPGLRPPKRSGPQKGNLFVVGDAKQSIFGFNDADVRVFLDRREAMSRSDNSRVIALADNFRSRPELIGFVNQVCADIWEEDEHFRFETLEPRREFATDPIPVPRVEVIAVPTAGASMDEVRQEEARALALRIQQLVGAGGEAPLRLTRADDQRDLRYGDILVLFRATTGVPIYESALFDAGVPYYVVSGRGFYSTPEVQNITNLLRVVHQPLHDYALAAVLRSPLCEVSDDTLYWLARADGDGRKHGRLWRGLSQAESVAAIDDEQRGRLTRLRDIVSTLQAMAPAAQHSRMIECAVEAADYGAKMLVQPAGKRRYANVRKLIEVAQQVEGDTGFGLGEFLDYLSSLSVLAEREAEAPTEAEQSDVVRLMTVHLAKGLEAPVVFVADLGRQIRPRPGRSLIDDENRVAIILRNPFTDQWHPTADYRRAAEQVAQREVDECKRLFYVALTRAEERLILVGGAEFKGAMRARPYRELPRWSDWIEKALGLDGPSEQERHLDLAPGVIVSVRSGIAGPPIQSRRRQRFRDRYRDSIAAGEPVPGVAPKAAATADRAAARASWALPAVSGPPPRLSVTALLDYDICPRLYWLRHVLEIGEGPSVQRGVSALRLGSLAHEALAQYDFTAAPGGQAAVERLDCDQESRRRIAEMIDRFRAMPVFGQIQEATERHAEIRFDLGAEGTIVSGVLDLLYRGPAAPWTVLDYKTGDVTDAARYDLQVAIYAHAVAEITGDAPQRVLLVPLSGGEVREARVEDALLGLAGDEMAELIKGVAERRFDRKPGEQCARCPYAGRWCEG